MRCSKGILGWIGSRGLWAVLVAGICMVGEAKAAPVLLAAWEITEQTNGGASPFAPTTLLPNITVGGLTRGSGVGAVTTSNVWGGNNFMSTSEAGAITDNKFATFSITAADPARWTVFG